MLVGGLSSCRGCSRDTDEDNNSEKLPWLQHRVAELLGPPVSHYGARTSENLLLQSCCL